MRFGALVFESEHAGSIFTRRLVGWANGANRLGRPAAAFVGVFDRQFGRFEGVKNVARTLPPRVGRMRHLYALSAFRRLGAGRRPMTEVIKGGSGFFAAPPERRPDG
jgi:hypothetical protein